jgi:hypothetical protein
MIRTIAVLSSTALLSIALASCGGGGSSALPSMSPATSPVASGIGGNTLTTMSADRSSLAVTSVDGRNVAAALAAQQRPDGAIAYTTSEVMPYFANLAAIGAAHVGAKSVDIRAYMGWYIQRSHDANPWGIAGAIADYRIKANGSLVSKQRADSVDSYAATFLTLVATAWKHGDATMRAYIQSIRPDVERIASAIDAVTDRDGLTWALPTYRVKYVMDASEVYAGLKDLALVRSEAFGDAGGALAASERAAQLRATIVATYWNETRGTFATALDDNGALELPDPSSWYDTMTQLWPILFGIVDPTSTIAQTTYARFNAGFPVWTALEKPDEYPWASVAVVALEMNDVGSAAAYRAAADAQYAPAYAYPWYCAESGWYLRMLAAMNAPQTVAEL